MQMKRMIVVLAATMAAGSVFAQQNARAAYMQQQAVQEVQRLSAQFDQLGENQEAIVTRLVRLETQSSSQDIRNEIESLKAQIAQLKSDQAAMEQRIVGEISRKMATLIAQHTPPPPPPAAEPVRTRERPGRSTRPPAAPAVTGNYYEHVVESGQTLSLIARGYETTVAKILAANPKLRAGSLRVGQKIIIPAEPSVKK